MNNASAYASTTAWCLLNYIITACWCLFPLTLDQIQNQHWKVKVFPWVQHTRNSSCHTMMTPLQRNHKLNWVCANVKLAITLISNLDEGEGKPGNESAHFIKFSISGGANFICHYLHTSWIYSFTLLTDMSKIVSETISLVPYFWAWLNLIVHHTMHIHLVVVYYSYTIMLHPAVHALHMYALTHVHLKCIWFYM